MKIVVKSIKDGVNDFLVYLKTDDDVSVSAVFATMDTYEYVIDDLIDECGEEKENVKIYMDMVTSLTPEEDSEEEVSNAYPLILVMYMNRELMGNSDIMHPLSEAINEAIASREANAMAFFVPTDGPERIECINPLIATEIEKGHIGRLISEIEKSFDINQGADD